MVSNSSLRLLKESGVDVLCAEEPTNFFERKDTQKPKPAAKKPAQKAKTYNQQPMANSLKDSANSAYSSLADTIAESRKLADEAKTLEDLRKAVESFDGCALKKTANKTVFADGTPKNGVLLIGEAPGADEDTQGIPFCGMSGQLLDKVMQSIKLDRESGFYITNTIFWRPPGNRKPTPEELAICQPFLEKHIALAAPKIILLVGATAVQAVLQNNDSMGKLRGKTYAYKNDYMDGEAEVMVTYHPSYLMRSPLNKRLAWDDMLMFDERIKSLG